MKVMVSKDFIKTAKKQSGKILQSIKTVLLEVEQADSIEDLTNCKKLVGYDNIYRLRIGSLRSFFVLLIEADESGEYTVVFEYLVNRGEAYSKEMNEKLRSKDS